MIPLKEDDTYAVLSDTGMAEKNEEGFFRHDTRFASRYAWRFPGYQLLMSASSRPDVLVQHWGLVRGPSQVLAVRRKLVLCRGGFDDELIVENTDLKEQSTLISLNVEADFSDLFEVRRWYKPKSQGASFSYRAEDGLESHLVLTTEPPSANRTWRISLKPKETSIIRVQARLESPLAYNHLPLLSYADWRNQFDILLPNPKHQAVLERAISDLRALLFSTDSGYFPAAGIPWYVTAFGRDSLLTALMTLPWAKDMARNVLRFLARHQGKVTNPFHEEEPGKILHEMRLGELSRTKKAPFTKYFGTVDATPLFLMLLREYWKTTGDFSLVMELKGNWQAAIQWILRYTDSDGLLSFSPSGSGLTVQSWKDSGDSMSHSDGSLGEPPIQVSEVQGYVYAALKAAAEFYKEMGNPGYAAELEQKALRLKQVFHQKFWLDDLQTYAIALDAAGPLKVQSSDPGQLLWTGIVPKETAPLLVKTLFSQELWSGWGLRTLGSHEVRYNPLSYHNGSVWPHDTILFAAGLVRYSFHAEAQKVIDALFDLAASQADLRLPELVGGYAREEMVPPVPYPAACRPQAWDSGAVILMARLLQQIP